MKSLISGFTKRRFFHLFLILPLICLIILLALPGITGGNMITSPTIVTNAATSVTGNSATINGALTSMGDAGRVDAFFYWGTVSGGPYNSTSTQGLDSPVSFSAALTNLSPCTTYYFKAAGSPAFDTNNQNYFSVHAIIIPTLVTGSEMSFTTTCFSTEQPKHLFTDDSAPTVGNPSQVHTRSLAIQPSYVYANQPVTVYAKVINGGDAAGGYATALKVNGVVEQTKTGNISGQTTQQLQFIIYKDQPGTYEVEIGGEKASFTVMGNTANTNTSVNNQTIIVLISGFALILLTTLIVLLIRRNHQ